MDIDVKVAKAVDKIYCVFEGFRDSIRGYYNFDPPLTQVVSNFLVYIFGRERSLRLRG